MSNFKFSCSVAALLGLYAGGPAARAAVPAAAKPAAAKSAVAAPAPANLVMVEDEVESTFDVRATLLRSSQPASLLLGYDKSSAPVGIHFVGNGLIVTRGSAPGSGAVLGRVVQLPRSTAATVPVVLQWRSGALRIIYNRRIVLSLHGLGALQGGVATAGAALWRDAVMQPVEPVHFADDFMRTATVTDLWHPLKGSWKLDTEGDTRLGANPFSYVAQGKPAISVAGRWYWGDYTSAASVRAATGGVVGMVAYWQDADNYLLFKWYARDAAGASAARKIQLWRVVNGRAGLLGVAPGGYNPDEWYRLSLRAEGGALSVTIDGREVLNKKAALFAQGQVGLYADGPSRATFDDVQVTPCNEVEAPQIDQAASGPARFANDQSMAEWSSPKGQWLESAADKATYWNRGLFFGDYAVTAQVSAITTPGARADALLAGDGTNPYSGYDLHVVPAPGGKSLQSVLLRSGTMVSAVVTTNQKPGATDCFLKLERHGDVIRGYVNDRQVAVFTDAQPLAGRRVGYKAAVAKVTPADAHIVGGNMLDYTFYQAPTDWMVGSGVWDLASRWICTPTWTWYSGVSDRLAALWNKRSFSGDFAIEVFAACKMDNAKAPYYDHPRDLNITVSGDGADVASGYSCIFGGWNNTSTRILRGTTTVARDDHVLLPTAYHSVAHHKWFCLRVEKVGDTISYYIDRKLTLQYKDPHPLAGKRLALWTSGNGIMIARATIYYEKEGIVEAQERTGQGGEKAAAALPNSPTLKLNWQVRGTDKGVQLAALAPAGPGQGPALRAVDADGGGNFAVAPQLQPFDALLDPRLTFQCKLDRDAAINLYVHARGTLHVVRLNGPAIEGDAVGAISLGEAAVAADGNWHNLAIDLGGRLKALYNDGKPIMVDELFLGNLGRDPYLQAGFGANIPGTGYTVRYFALRHDDNRLAQLVEPHQGASVAPVAALPAAGLKSAALKTPTVKKAVVKTAAMKKPGTTMAAPRRMATAR